MNLINVRNVHQALPEGCHYIKHHGYVRESRNGQVICFDGPLTTFYEQPKERVIFWEERDANPFFHLFESLWMLSGRNDVAFVRWFNGQIGEYSDDGKVFNGAYGHRWRQHFGFDQLKQIARALKTNPDCRRQVLTMFDAMSDLGIASKDIPCNTQAYFQRGKDGTLDMMVTNRSNDLIWGAYGANAVHFSILQEYMAAMVGCPVGGYWQVSFNSHIYLNSHGDLMDQMAEKAAQPPTQRTCPYTEGHVNPINLVGIPVGRWNRELSSLMAAADELRSQPVDKPSLVDPFLSNVAWPMLVAWSLFKRKLPGKYDPIFRAARDIIAPDWNTACYDWIERRRRIWEGKQRKEGS